MLSKSDLRPSLIFAISHSDSFFILVLSSGSGLVFTFNLDYKPFSIFTFMSLKIPSSSSFSLEL
jgi:hypothetical protein